jgi:peptidoglycan/xylan/chitin deacetylase (PgdA/CDA1 family)
MGLHVLLSAIAWLAMLAPAVYAGESVAGPNRTAQASGGHDLELREGGIVRGPTSSRRLALAFTGHSYAEGGETILNELARHKAKGSFFFTGEFLTNANFRPLVRRIVVEGHYLGPHSDTHVLYCPWEGPKKTLVSHAEFQADLESNLKKIEGFGVRRSQVRYFLPPYEHYNQEIVDWSKAMGLTLLNFTPGTRSNADYTGEADSNFVSSQTIFDSILRKEKQDPHGLNGFILLLHIGSGPGRADKFHERFRAMLDYLAVKGYGFVRVDELLAARSERNALTQ